jgi:hypothetical protein
MIPKKPFVVYRRIEPTMFTEHDDVNEALEAARRANIVPGAIIDEWLTTSARCFRKEVLRI